MEDLLACLLEPLLELLLEGILGMVAELFTESVTTRAETYSILREVGVEESVRPSRPVVVNAGCLIMGAAIGLVWSLDFPQRLTIPAHTIPSASIPLATIAGGLTMYCYGNWRRRHGGHPSGLATFEGGALFGYGLALARFLMVGR
ncbi:MAG TPA: hypothetical protein VN893_14975 [Bryobacteraceae bacterium]|nr:hypothetical protein [Bryobacteraceae bacterium]